MTHLGLYIPGRSVVHRMPVGAKLLALAMAITTLLQVRTVAWLMVAAVVAGLLFAVSGVPTRVALAQVRPLWWIAGTVGAFQVVVAGWKPAVVVVGQLVLAVALAALITLTTRVSAMLDALEEGLRPLRRVGLDPARVALVLALAIRAVPVVAGLAAEVRDAQRARGLAASPRAYAVPLLVRTLRHADGLGEALAARGLDD